MRTMPLAVTAWCFLSVTLYAQVSSRQLCLEFMRGMWGGGAAWSGRGLGVSCLDCNCEPCLGPIRVA